jgi:putative oxidoreductase
MKIAVIIVRVLMGLMFVFSSITFVLMVYFHMMPMPPMEGPIKTFNEGLAASVYFLPLLKITEFLCGLAFLSGRYVALACVVIAPVIVNILCVHLFVAPEAPSIVIALGLFFGNIFLAYANWDKYRPILTAK